MLFFFLTCCLNQKNSDGQTMLASTLIPQPQSMIHAPLEEDVNMSFGRLIHKCILHCSCGVLLNTPFLFSLVNNVEDELKFNEILVRLF